MKNNSSSISRDRHALQPSPYPSEDQLDGLKHSVPWHRPSQGLSIGPSKRLLLLRGRSSPNSSGVLRAEIQVWIFKAYQTPSVTGQQELHKYMFVRKIHLYWIWRVSPLLGEPSWTPTATTELCSKWTNYVASRAFSEKWWKLLAC